MILSFKKLIPLSLISCIASIAYAQPAKLTLKFDGSSSLNWQILNNGLTVGEEKSNSKTIQIGFNPSIGIFVSNHIELGLYSGYTFNKSQVKNLYDQEAISFIGPSIRGYFTKTKFSPFAVMNLGFSHYKSKSLEENDIEPSIFKMNGLNSEFGTGFEYFINAHFSFELSLYYTYYEFSKFNKELIDYEDNDVLLTHKGFLFRIGASILIPAKKKKPEPDIWPT